MQVEPVIMPVPRGSYLVTLFENETGHASLLETRTNGESRWSCAHHNGMVMNWIVTLD
jgi:hypothetical protein